MISAAALSILPGMRAKEPVIIYRLPGEGEEGFGAKRGEI